MLRTLRRGYSDLLGSTLHDEHSFYSAFSDDFKSAKKSIVIESPYITVRRSKELLPLIERLARKGVSVHISTRHPKHHDGELAHQAYKGITLLEQAGANVSTHLDMRHRKIAIIDGSILWEGSLNFLSHSNSREVMRRTKSRPLCQQMQRFLGSGL